MQILKDIFEGLQPITIRSKVESSPLRLEDLSNPDAMMESVRTTSKLNQVLGILSGPYFVPNGRSRNRRYYPAQLWEKVLREVSQDLKRTGRVGTLEHPLTESDAHPKHASHILKSLWIKNGLGYGKSYIINTPMGSLVHVLGTARDEEGNPLIQLYVSSRAYGTLRGKDEQGYDIVDPESYQFSTFDIVLEPGFLEAQPDFQNIMESVVKDILSGSLERKVFPSALPLHPVETKTAPRSEALELNEEASEPVEDWVQKAKSWAKAFISEQPEPSFSPTPPAPVSEASIYEELHKLREENETLKAKLQEAYRALQNYRLRDLSESYGIPLEDVQRLHHRLGSLEALEVVLDEMSRLRPSPPGDRKILHRRKEILSEIPESLEYQESPQGASDLEYKLLKKLRG